MSELINALKSLMEIPQFSATLGWVFGGAILIGGVLDGDRRDVIRWIFATFVYLIFQEFTRAALFTSMAYTTYRPIALAIVVSAVYLSGILFGWIIVVTARVRVRKIHKNGNNKNGG